MILHFLLREHPRGPAMGVANAIRLVIAFYAVLALIIILALVVL